MEIIQLKKNKTDDLNHLCQTASRDKPVTQEIRLRKYINPQVKIQSKNLSIDKLR